MKLLDPGRLFLEAADAERAGSHAPDLPRGDETRPLQDADVLLHAREGHLKLLREVCDGRVCTAELLQNPAPGDVRQRGERGVEVGLRILNHLVQYVTQGREWVQAPIESYRPSAASLENQAAKGVRRMGKAKMMQRFGFEHDGLTLSYLDTGGDRPLIIALHAMWMEARSFEGFAASMPEWRVVSLDQRGHGLSDHSPDYSRDAFIRDIAALLNHLGARDPVVLIGNSLGGTNAFMFAARHPERVRAMVIEEGPPEQRETLSFVLDWRGIYPTSEALERKIGERLAWSVKPSFRETARGWTLAFDPEELVSMKDVLNGDFWQEWLATRCPALVVRGTTSKAVDGKLLESMAAKRPNTEFVSLEAGHVAHHDDPMGFVASVRAFLQKVR